MSLRVVLIVHGSSDEQVSAGGHIISRVSDAVEAGARLDLFSQLLGDVSHLLGEMSTSDSAMLNLINEFNFCLLFTNKFNNDLTNYLRYQSSS